ncbi:hypothetical protein E2320_004904, partial [Naja naja]
MNQIDQLQTTVENAVWDNRGLRGPVPKYQANEIHWKETLLILVKQNTLAIKCCDLLYFPSEIKQASEGTPELPHRGGSGEEGWNALLDTTKRFLSRTSHLYWQWIRLGKECLNSLPVNPIGQDD